MQIDSALAACLDEVRGRYSASSAEPIVEEVIRATLPKGGRIRPLLCCLGYAAVRGENDAADPRIVKAAASLELLHSFAIIHDDVMDGSPMRRGEPSIHRRLADERLAAGGTDAELHGVSLAILAGDLALVISDLLFAESGFPQEVLVQAYGPLSAMRLDAIAGQYLDLTHSGAAGEDVELTSRIARLKTGSYSVEGPLLVGATLGGGSVEAKEALQAYGRPLGEAFQLADDLLGLFGDPAATGKDAENDIRRGKPTALIARAMAVGAPECRELIKSIWGNPRTTDMDLHALRTAIRDSGAVDAVASEISRLISEATHALDDAGDGGLSKSPCFMLGELAGAVSHRAKI
ncbi:MAG: polyprenyl synthetase family protein [Actinomycetota bacterium]